MCGVAGALGKPVAPAVRALAHRGPDGHGEVAAGPWNLGHVRLAIIDTTSASDQPMTRGKVTLIYNGECWNYRAVRAELEKMGRSFTTSGDTEVVAQALDEWGTGALDRLQGMWGMAWWDGSDLWLARDRHGEVPLHYDPAGTAFASELRGLRALGATAAAWVPPGAVVRMASYGSAPEVRPWYATPAAPAAWDHESAARAVRSGLAAGVAEREVADVEVCVLLSGGIDSSAVAALAHDVRVAYTAVSGARSPDLRHARRVAGALGLELREVHVPAPTPDDLARVVATIEMPHKAQVEIAWACQHLALAMSADGLKVVMSGEGSDELWASYGFAYHGLKGTDWYTYRQRLFDGQHRKNFARCNKVFMSHGIECRLPFLSSRLVEDALSMPRHVVEDKKADKAVMRRAFADLLPPEVTKRAKVAFQTGAGLAGSMGVADPARFYRAEYRRVLDGLGS